MYQQERLYEIIQWLKEKGTLTHHEIMERFDISRDTARRDIVKLVDEGVAIRTHGGITLCSINGQILGYNERQTTNLTIKKRLAKKAVQYLTFAHKTCFFDASTTILEVCRLVPGHINAYSNSLYNVEALSERCQTFMIGGAYHKENKYLYGCQLLNELDRIYFDFVYIGAASIKEDGIYVTEQEDAAIKNKLAQRSECSCIIYDDSKYLKKAAYKALDYNDINIIATNKMPPENILKEIKKAGCALDII